MATITTTATQLLTSTATASFSSASASSSAKVTPQGGILEGGNPSHYDPKNPVILFIIQAGIIILFCRLLHYPLSWIRQPRVIAEVIGGILLGPSVLGRIPGFSDAIFPAASMPNLNLVANLGLILFLFLVGLEVDLRYFVSNWKIALSVGTAGMALPFGLGCAIAWGLYHEFDEYESGGSINFGIYMLFIGVAMAITAFPVLCRILTELKLLSTPVGVIVLSAGVSNDVVGWILLALCVALVNAGTGIAALYVLLTSIAFILFLLFAVRPAFMYILRRSGALHDGPSQGIVTLTLMIALSSAFFTGVIGIHPIFGAFLAGLICPHEGGFAIKVTEKIEDLVSAILLPLYFALSGLSTNLGLLDSGITWAYVFAVIGVAFCAKLIGGTLGAKFSGLVWRESFTIGALMSCKGLVELIVLNIGLQANILSKRTFTIFVVMALVTTFTTTPLTAMLYPPWYQRKMEAWRRGEIDWESGEPTSDENASADSVLAEKGEAAHIGRFLVYLRLDSMPFLLSFVSLLGRKAEVMQRVHPSQERDAADDETTPIVQKKSVQVHGLRMVELNERGSTVMKVSEVDEYATFDPVLNAFRMLGQMFNLGISGEVTIIPESSFAETLTHKADVESSDFLLLPWSETGSLNETPTISNHSMQNKLAGDAYIEFVTQTLSAVQCNTAVLINNGLSLPHKQPRPTLLHRSYSGLSLRSHRESAVTNPRVHHIFMPFFGLGADDRVALRLVLQLAEDPEVTATIVHYESVDAIHTTPQRETVHPKGALEITSRAQSSSSSSDAHGSEAAFFTAVKRSLPADVAQRVIFEMTTSSDVMKDALTRAKEELNRNPRSVSDIMVVGRHISAFRESRPASGTPECLGAFAEHVVASGVRTSLLVVQAKTTLTATTST